MAGRRLRYLTIALAVAIVQPALVGVARAQTPKELDDARKLFGEALKDEQDKKFDVALEKFRRVQRVRDTISVRYRIAACLEGMRKLRDAQAAFAAIARESATGDDAETVRSAATRVDEIAARVPRVTLHLPPQAPSDAEVKIDDQIVSKSTLAGPIPLDPGDHVVSASGTGVAPFATRITLDERARIELTIPLGATAPAPSASAAPPATAPSASSGADDTRKTWGVVAIAGGGLLVGGSVLTYLLRHGDIAQIHRDCPNDVCPTALQSDVTSARNRALFELPLAIGLGVAGVAAAGVGLYLFVTPPKAAQEKSVSVGVGADGVVRLRGTF